MSSVVTPWNQFYRKVVTPYWCAGSPLDWQVDGRGLAHFAMDGRVGVFNLAWWLLGRAKPPTYVAAYTGGNLQWVLMYATQVKCGGLTLADRAAMCTLREWQTLILSLGSAGTQLEHCGVKYADLKHLALTGEREKPR